MPRIAETSGMHHESKPALVQEDHCPLRQGLRADERFAYHRLSETEKQVLELLMSREIMADRARTIGSRLGLARNTVKHHIRTIGQKYGVDSKRFIVMVRLAWLHAQEIGLIPEAE